MVRAESVARKCRENGENVVKYKKNYKKWGNSSNNDNSKRKDNNIDGEMQLHCTLNNKLPCKNCIPTKI